MGDILLLNVAATMSRSHANGPGIRAVIWVQGCTIGCPGCYNAFTHLHEVASLQTPSTIAEWVLSIDGIEGVSFSGGEPFEQAAGVLEVIQHIRKEDPTLTFFAYSGYELDYLENSSNPHVVDLLSGLDMLCAGPYVHSLKQPELLWKGSTNQSLHYLSTRYHQAQEDEWKRQSPMEEYHLDIAGLNFSGFGGSGSKTLKTILQELDVKKN